jgi:Swt1-like HEPN
MGTTNRERVGKALELLKVGLRPYFEREMRASLGDRWIDEASNSFREGRLPRDGSGAVNWDVHAILSVTSSRWNSIFSNKLSKAERNLVEELRLMRNDWAHQKPFSTDDTYRALDSAERLLRAIGAEQEAGTLKRLRLELLEEVGKPGRDAFASAQPTTDTLTRPHSEAAQQTASAETGTVSGKYRPLHAHLMRARTNELTMTFEEIENVLGIALPPSAYNHQAWWSNEDPTKTVLRGKRSWLLAGFKAYPDMRLRRVTFRRGLVTS